MRIAFDFLWLRSTANDGRFVFSVSKLYHNISNDEDVCSYVLSDLCLLVRISLIWNIFIGKPWLTRSRGGLEWDEKSRWKMQSSANTELSNWYFCSNSEWKKRTLHPTTNEHPFESNRNFWIIVLLHQVFSELWHIFMAFFAIALINCNRWSTVPPSLEMIFQNRA